MLCLARSSLPDGLLESDAYVWQRRWTPAVAAAVTTNTGLFRTWHVLAAEIAANGTLTATQADWSRLAADGHAVVAVVRIEGQIDAGRVAGLADAVRTPLAALPAGIRGRSRSTTTAPRRGLPGMRASCTGCGRRCPARNWPPPPCRRGCPRRISQPSPMPSIC